MLLTAKTDPRELFFLFFSKTGRPQGTPPRPLTSRLLMVGPHGSRGTLETEARPSLRTRHMHMHTPLQYSSLSFYPPRYMWAHSRLSLFVPLWHTRLSLSFCGAEVSGGAGCLHTWCCGWTGCNDSRCNKKSSLTFAVSVFSLPPAPPVPLLPSVSFRLAIQSGKKRSARSTPAFP